MKLAKILLAVLLLLFTFCSFTQNLIIDGGFESAEQGLNQGTWTRLLGDRGTPDLWNESTPEENLNYGLCKSIDPFEGVQIVGIILVNAKTWSCKTREFLRGQLKQPLEKGVLYRISVKARMSNLDLESMYPITDIGVSFTKDISTIESVCESRVKYLPLRAKTPVISSNGRWQHIENTFRAKGGEKYITIGGFLGASYKSIMDAQSYKSLWSYFFFDAFELVKVDSTTTASEIVTEEVTLPTLNKQKVSFYFDYDSKELRLEDQAKLDQVINFLHANPSYALDIRGHTDDIGGSVYNQKLSDQRANEIKQQFINRGLGATRLASIGFGSEKKKYTDNTQQAHQGNRRVDLILRYREKITKNQLAAIKDFTRIYGYLRFFYPREYSENFNWEKFAAYIVAEIRKHKTVEDIQRVVDEIISELAPRTQISTIDQFEASVSKKLDGNYIFWQHAGLGCGGNESYESRLVSSDNRDDWLFPHEPFEDRVYYTNSIGMKYEFPILLPEGISSDQKIEELGRKLKNTVLLEEDFYLGNTIIVWNVIQHSYPYLDYLKLNWLDKIDPFLNEASSIENLEEYDIFIRKLSASIVDGHSHAGTYARDSRMPLWTKTAWQNENLTVIKSQSDELVAGDIILSIDSKPVLDEFKKDTVLISGSPQWKEVKALKSIGAGAYQSIADLVIERERIERTVQVTRKRKAYNNINIIEELEEDIHYVDLTSFYTFDTLLLRLQNLENPKGLIFDMRGYPSFETYDLLPYLLTEPDTVNNWIWTPQIVNPDLKHIKFIKEGWSLKPMQPRLPGKYIFLMDGSAISASESFLAIVKHYQLGKIVGSPTAGANGARNWIQLPLGYSFHWTGMYVTDLGGKVYHGTGLPPDIHIKSGDDILKKSIESIME